MDIAIVPIPLVDVIYPLCETYINDVIERAENDISNEVIKSQLKRGETLMVVICEEGDVIAVNIMEPREFETGHRVMLIPITAGIRMSEWLDDFLELAHQIAKGEGCQELRGISCRKGWTRALRDYGWYDIHTVIGCKVK